jgi:hypothetical protein
MGKKLLKAAVIGSMLSIAMVLMPGCSKTTTASSDNGNSSGQLAADEVSNMGADEAAVVGNQGGVGKIFAAAAAAGSVFTDSISYAVHPYQYISPNWIRTATLTTAAGYVRTRVDTITFFNAAGVPVEYPRLDSFTTLHHLRTVTQSKGDILVTLTIDVTDSLKKGTDTTFVKNGTITGTCDGQTLKTGLISNVTRVRSDGVWQFPSAGTISVDLPRYDFSITFTGNYSATLYVDNLVTGKTRTVYLTVSEK